MPAGESGAAADLLENAAHGMAVRGELRTLAGLVRHLPGQEVLLRPGLRMWMIRLDLYARDFDACGAGIQRLRADLPADDAVNHFALTLIEAMLAVQRDDAEAAMALLPQLLDAPAGTDAMTLGGRDNILSWLYMQRGDYERARRIQLDNPERLVDGAPLLGTASGTLQGRCLIGLSYAMQGQITQAERIYRDVLRDAELGGGACTEPGYLATALLSEVLYEQNDPQAMVRLVQERVEVLERVSIPDSVLRLFYMLAASHRAMGHKLESFAWLERLEDSPLFGSII